MSRLAASRIVHVGRGIGEATPYGKRMDRLSKRIFGEVVSATDKKSMKVVRVMSAEPYETKEQLSVKYYPNLPMFHYLTKMLRFHGLFFDDHVIFRQVQDELKILRGKVVRPPIGQGKRALLRGKNNISARVRLIGKNAKRVLQIAMKRTADGKVKDNNVDMFGNAKAGVWEAKHSDTILIYTHNKCEPREKIAAFDMDGTLITTKSGKVFPVDLTDWRMLYNQVVPRMKKLFGEEEYKIVIFTNQKGLQTGKVNKKEFKQKMEAIIAKLGVPCQAFVSIGDGEYRKPCTGMWKELLEANGEVDVDVSKSLYVGDAAGRHKTKTRPKKDHSCADRFFAMNVGVKFYTPEEFFLNQKTSEPWGPPAFDPVAYLDAKKPLLEPKDAPLPSSEKEVIVIVGFPGSGKSTFARMLEKEHGYMIVNRDTLGTWQKCCERARVYLRDGKSVVVDNTNPDKESRSRYTALAKEMKVPCRCFELTCDLNHANHNVKFRLLTEDDHNEVTIMVLRTYAKRYQDPELSEGFDSIVHVNFVPRFATEELEKVYKQYLLES